MPFLTKGLIVREINPRDWAIQHDLVYEGAKEVFTVPRGFVTDFASVPRFATWLIPVYGLYTKVAILHDWFIKYAIGRGIISSSDADGIFRRVMREEGVPFLMAWIMWTGVRWGALLNHRRRAGWFRGKDPWLVVLITLLGAPFLLPAFAAVGLGLFVWEILELFLFVIGKGVRWCLPRSSARSSVRASTRH